MNAMPIPPNVNMDDKFYIGFYTDGTLLAVMDLIRNYPPKRNNEQTEKPLSEYTPMMQKYLETKKEYPGCILFYRLGDFYEMFFEDAKIVSKELELTLTGKSCGKEERAPMCGVPFHAVEGYLNRLVAKGYKVAICEQVEDPKMAWLER